MLIDFDPRNSLYFSTNVTEDQSHFLGIAGDKVASTCMYFIGRAAWVLAILLAICGYVLLRRLSSPKKVMYLLLGGATIFLFMVFFSYLNRDVLYKGGGIFGNYVEYRLESTLKSQILLVMLLAPLTGALFILVKPPVYVLLRFFRKGDRKEDIKDVRPVWDEKMMERDTHEGREAAPSISANNRTSRKNDKGSRTKRTKLPLFQRVIINAEDVVKIRNPIKTPIKRTPPPRESEEVRKDLIHESFNASSYLKKSTPLNKKERERETARKALELERTLLEFGIEAKVTGIIRGPVITRYELQPAPGVKLSRIENLSNNIALSLSANGVRIEAPIPGRAAVGIEIPNDEREVVTLGDILEEGVTKGELPLILGKNISGDVVVSDLTAMPHLLISGATGAGKSVCVNSLIMSIIFQKEPEDVRLMLMDPKMVELKMYNGIPHLLTEVITDPRDAAKALRWIIYEMENRYRMLDENYARNITGYNQKASQKMPYIVIIVDEYANLMAISQKEVEDAVVRLAAMSRAVGIHLIMATQRPSVDVITGLIKANFPYRIAFQVASRTDSRTILDSIGAEKLLGKGDMLFAPAGSTNIQRIQGAFISEEEVFRIVKELKRQTSPAYVEDIFSSDRAEGFELDFEDPLFEGAVEIVLSTKRASASFLQRRLKIGYNRAARLIELMEEKGIIGPPRGSKPREIYVEHIE
jgi:DNA segregation ATPase FtsK/SpoIIIE-like protein